MVCSNVYKSTDENDFGRIMALLQGDATALEMVARYNEKCSIARRRQKTLYIMALISGIICIACFAAWLFAICGDLSEVISCVLFVIFLIFSVSFYYAANTMHIWFSQEEVDYVNACLKKVPNNS